jgi:hypothetical protein
VRNTLDNRAKPLLFRRLPTGCWIIVNRKTNQDGYFRKRWGNEIEMFHRFIWRAKKGEISEGYEINHMCKNRGCCEITHLELLSTKEHKVITNTERWVNPSGIVRKPKRG